MGINNIKKDTSR